MLQQVLPTMLLQFNSSCTSKVGPIELSLDAFAIFSSSCTNRSISWNASRIASRSSSDPLVVIMRPKEAVATLPNGGDTTRLVARTKLPGGARDREGTDGLSLTQPFVEMKVVALGL